MPNRPGEIHLPTGEYAMVAHRTDWLRNPFIHMNGRWYCITRHRSMTLSSEETVRLAISESGYVPVFFGLKMEAPPEPTPDPNTVTFTYAQPPTVTWEDLLSREQTRRRRTEEEQRERVRQTLLDRQRGTREHERLQATYERYVATSANTYVTDGYLDLGGSTIRVAGGQVYPTVNQGDLIDMGSNHERNQGRRPGYRMEDTTRSYPGTPRAERERRN